MNLAVNYSNQKMILVLFSGLFLGLVSSQSLMDLFIGLTSLYSLYLMIRNKELALMKSISGVTLFSLIWVFFLFTCLIVQGKPLLAIKTMFSDFVWIIHLPLWYYLWTRAKMNPKWLVVGLTIFIIASLFAVFVYLIGFDPLQQKWSDRSENLMNFWRSGGLFSNAMALAQSYGPLSISIMPLSVYYLFCAYSNLKNSIQKKSSWSFKILFPSTLSWLFPLTLLFGLLAVLFTFTRGVWLSLFITSLLGSFMFNRKTGLAVLGVMVVGSLALLSSWPKFRERTFQVFDSAKSYDSERLVLWKTNWFIFSQNPIIGIGYGENKRLLREYYDQLGVPKGQFEGHAHNQFLHFLAGTGVVGLIFYLLWCFYFFKINYKLFLVSKSKLTEEYGNSETESTILSLLIFGVLLAQISFHFGSLTESNFIIAKNRMLLVFLWSLILFQYEKTKAKMSQVIS